MSAPQVDEREIVTVRVVEAPPGLVYRAWTEPEHLARWWGPNGFANTFDVFEPRPGGAWRFTMHGPNGADYPNASTFLALAPPGRIVLDHVSPPKFRVTATFEAEDGKTRVTFRQGFETAAESARVRKFAADANEQNMDRLALELGRMAAGDGAPPFEVALERLIAAPRERVFEAWSAPGPMKRWFAPRPYELVVHEMDFRPGGRFRMAMRGPKGDAFPFTGRYREIVAPERLVWTSEFATGPAEQMTTVVAFEAEGERTRVRVRQTFHVVPPEVAGAIAGANQGWTMTLDQLAAVAEAA